MKALWNEFKVVRACGQPLHPNIAHFREFAITPSYAMIVMDYYRNAMNVALPQNLYAGFGGYFHQLLSCVIWLHNRYVTHCDIKVANLLVDTAQDAMYGKPMLVDFGFATLHDEKTKFISTQTWGTPEYLSPERSRGDRHDERLSDVWALGVTFFELATGRTPFEQMDEQFLTKEQLDVYYKRTLTGEWIGDFDVPVELEKLCRGMLNPDPQKRIYAQQAIEHPFFRPQRNSATEASLVTSHTASTAEDAPHFTSEMQSDDVHQYETDAAEKWPAVDDPALFGGEGDVSAWTDDKQTNDTALMSLSESQVVQSSPVVRTSDALHERVRIVVDEVADESTLSALRLDILGSGEQGGCSERSSSTVSSDSNAVEIISLPRVDDVHNASTVVQREPGSSDDRRPGFVREATSSSEKRHSLHVGRFSPRTYISTSPGKLPSTMAGDNLLKDGSMSSEWHGPALDPGEIGVQHLPLLGTIVRTGTPADPSINTKAPFSVQDLRERLDQMEKMVESLAALLSDTRALLKVKEELVSALTQTIPPPNSLAVEKDNVDVQGGAGRTDDRIVSSGEGGCEPAPGLTRASSTELSPQSAGFDLITISRSRPVSALTGPEGVLRCTNPLMQHLQAVLDKKEKPSAESDVTLSHTGEVQQGFDEDENDGDVDTEAQEIATNWFEQPKTPRYARGSPSERRERISKVRSLTLRRSGSLSMMLTRRHSGVSTATATSTVQDAQRSVMGDQRATWSRRDAPDDVKRTQTGSYRTGSRPISQPNIAVHKRQTSEVQRQSHLFHSPSSKSYGKGRPATSYASFNDSSKVEHLIGIDPPRSSMSAHKVGGGVQRGWERPSTSGSGHPSASGGALWRMLTNRITSVRNPRS